MPEPKIVRSGAARALGTETFAATVLASPPAPHVGRYVFGLAAFAFGVITLAWPDDYGWLHLQSVWSAPQCRTFDVVASVAQIVGGVALQFHRTARGGAAVLCADYAIVAVLSVSRIFAAPRSYEPYGNFFEQFSLATGAGVALGHLAAPVWSSGKLRVTGRVLVGFCTAFFAIQQASHRFATASLVPTWIPPDRTFWADATTVAFALAATALLANRLPLLAARLLTAMLVAFGVLVRLPLLSADVHSRTDWSETAATFAIAGAAWILADLLGDKQFGRVRHTEFDFEDDDAGPL
jgi:hypothetical protein